MKIKNVLFTAVLVALFASSAFASPNMATTGKKQGHNPFGLFHKRNVPNPNKYAYEQGNAKGQTKAFKKAADAFNKAQKS